MFGSADYELCWPSELFARELAALRAGPKTDRHERIAFLFEEAFLGEAPTQDFTAAAARASTPWGSDPWDDLSPEDDADGFLDRLEAHRPQLREHHQPAPYWPARHGQRATGSSRDIAAEQFTALINKLHARGYFGRALPPPCVDDCEPIDESAVLAERLGLPDLWPLRPGSWNEDSFFGLVEVFHDLAVRPRARSFHSYNGCGWHYSSFGVDTGRALYRWLVNRLLASAGLTLQLAQTGEDTGRLVHTVDDSRTDLIDQALQISDRSVAERVKHAVALFRARAATSHDKRSAVLTLAGIMEERRELVRAKIGTKDEGDLFTIANKFAIRHQRRDQQGDYDPIFLDWIFWWYLATIELTDQLAARPRAAGPAA